MGSTGSGRFSDYSGRQSSNSGGGGNGGASGTDRCQQAFTCTLEEVSQCDYFANNGALPAPQTPLSIVLDGRLFAQDANGVRVGALPTKFNYLAACIADGNTYIGAVKATRAAPHPSITADFVPQ